MSPFAFNPFSGNLDVVSDLSGRLKIDQSTDPQTTVGTFTFPAIGVTNGATIGAGGAFEVNLNDGSYGIRAYGGHILAGGLDLQSGSLNNADGGVYSSYFQIGNSGDAQFASLYDRNSGAYFYIDSSGNAYFAGTIDTPSKITGEMAKVQTSAPSTQVGDLWLDTDADPEYKFGDSSDYTMFDPSTGHQTMVGDAKPWEDLRIEPSARTTGANAPTFEKWYDDSAGTSRGVYLYSFDDAAGGSEKEVFFTMQMPHAWDGGSIAMHVHWVGAVDDTTADPRWGLEYAWKDIGEVFGDTTIVYSDGTHVTTAGADANVTAGKHYITEFADLAPGSTADGLSSILIGRLFRDSANAADTYNAAGAKCGLLYIDAHYQLNSLGSDEEYTK
jgi:hypothetical protein